MNMELITSAASDALVNVVLAIIALAGAYGVYYIRLGAAKLKEQTAQIKDEAGRKVLEDALDDVVNLATVSVGAMEQTTAKALRDAVKNGTASREELLALGKQVFDEVKAAIAPEAQQVITDNLGSFDKYLTAVIEDAVLQIGELLRDVRDGDEVVGEKRVRHLPHEQRVLVPFRQGPDDVAPDRLVLPDLLLRHVVKVCHGLLSLLCLHPI